jgi:FKBP-type peptidyl-prolyl cis-trans isomerase FkpA
MLPVALGEQGARSKHPAEYTAPQGAHFLRNLTAEGSIVRTTHHLAHRFVRTGAALGALAALAHGVHAEPAGADATAGKSAAGSGTATTFKTDDERAAYALGMMIARGFSFIDLSDEEYARFLDGMRDLRAGAPALKMPQEIARIEAFQRARQAARTERERVVQEKFIAEAKQAKKTETLPYGVVLQTVAEGKGEPPQGADQVTLRYETYLPDGTLVDSSELRGGEASKFPLMKVVMPCWSQALPKMKPGAKARLSCPSDAAYGPSGLPPLVPPGSAVRFELELIKVDKAPPALGGRHGAER